MRSDVEKPIERLTLTNISGTAAKGIALANIKDAKLAGLSVKVSDGALLTATNVSGTGLDAK